MDALPVIEPPNVDVPSCCGTSQQSPDAVTTKFHFSLNVSDLKTSVAFYEKLFGIPPAKNYDDYAKFELEQPPLVFALVPNAPASQGALSHMGFPVSSREEVEAVARRLEQAGLSICAQDGTVCGYARQDKIWVADPDHNFWEVYVVLEDVDPRMVNAGFDGASRRANASGNSTADETTKPTKELWEHRVAEGAIRSIPYADESLDEIRLTGTFNAPLTDQERLHILNECLRTLKPGGSVQVHGLIASRKIAGALPTPPGVAALVKRVPTLDELLAELQSAGLRDVRITKLPEKPAFTAGGTDMHEVKVRAAKSAAPSNGVLSRTVIYKGPFATTTDDQGAVFPRGGRVAVTEQQWDQLATGAAAASFLFVDQLSEDQCGCN